MNSRLQREQHNLRCERISLTATDLGRKVQNTLSARRARLKRSMVLHHQAQDLVGAL